VEGVPRNKCFFRVRISYVLRFISICDLFTDAPSYIMAPESISLAYFRNPSHQSACLYVYLPIVARHRLGKNPPIVAMKRLGEKLPRQRIYSYMQQYKNCWKHNLLCGPCRIKESRRLVLPTTSCLILRECLAEIKLRT
jgi:hypothetical protein